MPVGKGSIQRAAKAKAAAEKKEEVVEMAVETKAVKRIWKRRKKQKQIWKRRRLQRRLRRRRKR